MKALVLKEYNVFEYSDVAKPEIKPDEVLIKVHTCGICGSDVHGMDGSSGRRIPPVIMGHEASGIIESVGPEVTAYQTGDKVTFDSTLYCGTCWYCRKGLINLCENRRVLGVSCDEYRMHGAYAEYVAVPERILYPLPAGMAFEHAAFIEPVSVAVHAVGRVVPRLDSSVAVVGAGMIGLLVVQALRVSGCGPIIAVDIDNDRLTLAKSMGATCTGNPKEDDVAALVAEATHGRGVDYAFEVVGNTATVQSSASLVRKGGNLVLVGNLSSQVEFPLQTIVTREISVFGSCSSQGEYPECISLVSSGKIDVSPMISACVPLSEGANWFKRLYKSEPGLMKVMLQP